MATFTKSDWNDVPWWWKFGGPRNFWLEELALIGDFIKEQKLSPITPSETPLGAGVSMPAAQGEMLSTQRVYWPGPLHGGIRVPHLHYAGQFYLLNGAQWANFTKRVMKNVNEKLSEAQRVGFGQLLDLAEATHNL